MAVGVPTKPDGTLSWDVAKLSEAFKVGDDDIREFCTDGRKFSFVVERRIAYEVLKGSLAPSEGASFDVLDPAGRKWEVRSITKSGIYFCPSYMVGSQRSFNERGFLEKLDEIEGYIVADLVKFPLIPYWSIPKLAVREWWDGGRLGSTTKITRVRALDLIAAI